MDFPKEVGEIDSLCHQRTETRKTHIEKQKPPDMLLKACCPPITKKMPIVIDSKIAEIRKQRWDMKDEK